MKKKLLLGVITVVAVVVGVVGMSAFEAHIINVTATIENALNVDTTPIEFGTVFPQEAIDETIDIALSQSFMDAPRVDDINYMIRQKPKCVFATALGPDGYLLPDLQLPPETELYARVTEDLQGNYICEDDRYVPLPVLCPFLSKHEITEDGLDPTGAPAENDSLGINAFHGPLTGWNLQDTIATQVLGRLAKSEQDILDTWNIDFRVPCFSGQCAQDWAEFVAANNPDAIASDYILEGELEHALFGCDLWIEVTEVSLSNGDLCTNADVMLTLDRSGSISNVDPDDGGPLLSDLQSLKNAAHSFVTALLNGVHIGQTSFSTTATLDEHLTDNPTVLHAAIDALVSGGNTNLEDAILTSSAELADGVHDRTDATSPDFMLIITDGNPTASNGPLSHSEDAKVAADAAKAAGTTIIVVGVGTVVNSAYLADDIASPGLYFSVADYSALEVLLDNLATCDNTPT